MGERLLVTGAAGFIGRACLSILSGGPFELHAVSRRPRPNGPATWHPCDLLDDAASDALIRKVRPTHLLHLAWIAEPGAFWTSPLNAQWLSASRRLVSAFYREGGMRAVCAGSCAEYGRSDSPCREDATPLAPATPYGAAKLAMYESLKDGARGAGWAWARIFFPYGPGEPAGRFIPTVIGGLLGNGRVECTHGEQVRDFVFVEDVARALAALLRCEPSGDYNVGSGQGVRLRDVGFAAAAQIGGADRIDFGALPAPEHDAPVLVADIGKIGRDAAWSPHVNLDEGIRRTIAARISAGSAT
ncbi:MAG TPA: NAD-dependent epimerase/dehydratase [Burkholderiales bacterium]|nr:NAD-dependent epimerase/dehydratase [Burkholderiales bacterium]